MQAATPTHLSSETPTEVSHGVAIQRQDLRTRHEEADLIMVQQAYKAVLDHGADSVYVLCDDTDVLVLLCYFFLEAQLILQSIYARY